MYRHTNQKTDIMFRLLSVVNLSCLFYSILQSKAASINDTEKLYKYLTRTPKHIKPRVNQSDNLNVDFFLTINSIQNYDEIYGSLAFTGTFAMYWHDEIRTWEPSLFGGINATDIPLSETWTPSLVILNGIDHISAFRFDDELDIAKSAVTYYSDGRAKVLTSGLYEVTCLTNVKYYPIDKHDCTIFVTTAYLLKDVTLTSNFGFHLMTYFPNAEWFITYENARKSVLEVIISEHIHTRQDKIDIPIYIERRYTFSLLNVIIPVLILSFAHCLVYKIPVQSGEKASLAFTLFLMIVVFLTMVVEKLPHSASISIINAFLLQQLISSGLTTLVAVYSIKIYYMKTATGYIYKRIWRFCVKWTHFKEWIKNKCRQDRKVYNDNQNNEIKNIVLYKFQRKGSELIHEVDDRNKRREDKVDHLKTELGAKTTEIIDGSNNEMNNEFPGKEISICLDEVLIQLRVDKAETVNSELLTLDTDYKVIAKEYTDIYKKFE